MTQGKSFVSSIVFTLSACVLFFLACTPFSTAGVIQLTTSVNVDTIAEGANQSMVLVQLTNTGDDTAEQVSVSGWSGTNGIRLQNVGARALPPNSSVSVRIPMEISAQVKQGTHALAVIASYQDANGFSFSSVSPMLFSIGSPKDSLMQVLSPTATVSEKGSTTYAVQVRNLGETPTEVNVFLVLPREFSSGGSSTPFQNIPLPPKSEKSVEFPITALGALAGSSYVVAAFAIPSERASSSTAAYGRGVVKVERESNSPYLIGAFALLAAGIGIYGYMHVRTWAKK